MNEAYRRPSARPHHDRIVELLKQSRTHLATFAASAQTKAFHGGVTMWMRLLGYRHGRGDNDAVEASLDMAHKSYWDTVNEARTLLVKAGYEVGGELDEDGVPRPLWFPRTSAGSAERVQAALEALLPNVDFTVEAHDDADAYLAAGRRRKLALWIALAAVLFGAPLGAYIWFIFTYQP